MPSPRTDSLALPDVNVLVALVHEQHIHHQLAHDWFASAASFATTPATEAGLLRIALNARVMGHQVSPSAALASLRSVRDDPRARFIADNVSFADPRVDLSGLSGYRQVTDLHLVNVAAQNSAVLVTFDRGIVEVLVRRDRRHVHVIG